jgi:hypothetical protein
LLAAVLALPSTAPPRRAPTRKVVWYVVERKPAAIRRREVVDCYEDLDCLIAGIHFDADLRVFKIYFVSTSIAAG